MSTEEFEVGRFDDTLKLALRKGIRDAIFGAFSSAFNSYLDLGAGVLILWYGGSIAMEPDKHLITVGKLITYQLYWNMLNNSMQALNNVLNQFTRAAGAAERVLSLVDLEPDIDPKGGAPAEIAIRAWSIEFVDVVFRYQMRPLQTVLDGMSFRVEAGQVCALVGKSGGGKSTMVHLMLRFYDPTEGCVKLGDVDMRELNLASVHRRIGVVSQEVQASSCHRRYDFQATPATPVPGHMFSCMRAKHLRFAAFHLLCTPSPVTSDATLQCNDSREYCVWCTRRIF